MRVLPAWGGRGLGFSLRALTLGSVRGLGRNRLCYGSSGINFLRVLGGACGVSLCAIVLEWRIAAHGDSLANSATSPARVAAFHEAFLMLAALLGAIYFARPEE